MLKVVPLKIGWGAAKRPRDKFGLYRNGKMKVLAKYMIVAATACLISTFAFLGLDEALSSKKPRPIADRTETIRIKFGTSLNLNGAVPSANPQTVVIDVPANTVRIELAFQAISMNPIGNFGFRLQTRRGVKTSGYKGGHNSIKDRDTRYSTSGSWFVFATPSTPSDELYGTASFQLFNVSGRWSCEVNMIEYDNAAEHRFAGGLVTLGDELTHLVLYGASGGVISNGSVTPVFYIKE